MNFNTIIILFIIFLIIFILNKYIKKQIIIEKQKEIKITRIYDSNIDYEMNESDVQQNQK